MQTITLSAHIDGERIQLDEPFDLPSDARLLVTVVPPEIDSTKTAWLALSKAGFARAYADDEPEYPAHLVRPMRESDISYTSPA